ncbi:hypothetical protein TIFTF001_015171 [Ficus carica]|uniref:Uncharacterized protein n=1 Tax=Ficus carica TaxID=3494 RepID=A0AA88AHB0_FICCA|nr:hypothetical protein TIFTF001_015171 [Ficus carica]
MSKVHCTSFLSYTGLKRILQVLIACSLKMSSFAAKLVALLLLFDLGVNLATSTLLPCGNFFSSDDFLSSLHVLVSVDAFDSTHSLSSLVYEGDRNRDNRPSSHVFHCRGVLRRRITARKEGDFGCKNSESVEQKSVPSRSLRLLPLPPPPPIQNRPKSLVVTAPPPLIA